VNANIRPITKDDEPFLWQMLYYASHMNDEGATSPEETKSNPDLAKYVKDWGRATDMGFLALDPHTQQPVGAAWVRLLISHDKTISYIDDSTPELAIAVLPEYIGKGLGTQLLTHLLQTARHIFPAIVLSVRSANPAKRLYEKVGFVTVSTSINRVGTESFNMLVRFS
jgi:ribosomal protein S18 acetylase RimI-like enzyme